MIRLILFMGLVLSGGLAIQGQHVMPFVLTPEGGLPSELCKAVGVDRQGYIWVATDAGVVRYDGTQVTEYDSQTPITYPKSFLQADDQRLFVIHDQGLTEIHVQDTSVCLDLVLPARAVQSDSTLWYPKSAVQDLNGHLWISEPQSIVRYDGKRLHRYAFPRPVSGTRFPPVIFDQPSA